MISTIAAVVCVAALAYGGWLVLGELLHRAAERAKEERLANAVRNTPLRRLQRLFSEA